MGGRVGERAGAVLGVAEALMETLFCLANWP
jgi:hypothetical protein